MSYDLKIYPLALHRDALPQLVAWFEKEWPEWYGPGRPGDATMDLEAFANSDGLPQAVVALCNGELCGVAALKKDSIPSHNALTPWAAAGLVKPGLRGQGIGARLLAELESVARGLGYRHIYCGTATAENLLHREGWTLLEHVVHDGEALGIYQKSV